MFRALRDSYVFFSVSHGRELCSQARLKRELEYAQFPLHSTATATKQNQLSAHLTYIVRF